MRYLKLFLLLMIAAPSMAQQAEEWAEIKFEKTLHDFGVFKEGTMATYEFVFTNIGKIPLVLSNVEPSCGCTAPEWSKEPVMPGQKGKIKAIYNSYARPGNFQKYITVTSNTASKEVVLTIKGTVTPIPPEPVSPVRIQN